MAQSVIVVGGGIFGAMGALELRRRGYKVMLFDPGPLPHPNAASTDISKMVRMDYGADELYMDLMEQALPQWNAWNREWKTQLYHEDGFLIMARGEMQPGSFELESLNLLLQHGHKPERMDSKTLKARFPAWAAENYQDGYLNMRGGWAESANVVAKIIQMARMEGVLLHPGKQFQQLAESDARVTGIVTTDGKIRRADYVIMAAGTWTPTLLPHLQDVMWSVGQPVLHFKPANPGDYRPPKFVPWAADIANTGWYGFTANAEGIFKVANHGTGRRLHPDEPRVVGPEEEVRFREFLSTTFPGVADAPLVGTRLCLYCDTWDGNFWIDHDPQRPGLMVAGGGSGHGFKFAPVLGKIIADVLQRKNNRWAMRFAWRERGEITTEDARHITD